MSGRWLPIASRLSSVATVMGLRSKKGHHLIIQNSLASLRMCKAQGYQGMCGLIHRVQGAGLSPAELTAANLDKSQLLEQVLREQYPSDATMILGELQVLGVVSGPFGPPRGCRSWGIGRWCSRLAEFLLSWSSGTDAD